MPSGARRVISAVWTDGTPTPYKTLADAPSPKGVENLGRMIGSTADFDLGDGAVYASLTWNDRNALAGGAYSEGELTEKGVSAIKKLEKSGIFLDVAHLNRRSFWQATEVSDRPVLCSHACFDGLYGHPRNLTDAQIGRIIATGGIVGVTLVPEFMGKTVADETDVFAQIDYFCERFGSEHLAIGTDFCGCASPAIGDYASFERLKALLIRRGYTERTVERIFYENAFEFFGE